MLSAAGTVRVRPTIGDLTSTGNSTVATTVWLVFRAPDCGLSAELIRALNSADRSKRVQVVGVMLSPPGDSSAQQTLARALGMRFEMVYDDRGVWRGALRRERQREPIIYVRDGSSLLGGVSPAFMQQFAALSLTNVPMERER
ncbi:MAG: hypothetical protein C0497_13385 [Gemmatimonas sp.]|nr:hypothetical protein [Gemmatimonas sp.]